MHCANYHGSLCQITWRCFWRNLTFRAEQGVLFRLWHTPAVASPLQIFKCICVHLGVTSSCPYIAFHPSVREAHFISRLLVVLVYLVVHASSRHTVVSQTRCSTYLCGNHPSCLGEYLSHLSSSFTWLFMHPRSHPQNAIKEGQESAQTFPSTPSPRCNNDQQSTLATLPRNNLYSTHHSSPPPLNTLCASHSSPSSSLPSFSPPQSLSRRRPKTPGTTRTGSPTPPPVPNGNRATTPQT